MSRVDGEFFAGFTTAAVDTGEARIHVRVRVRHGGRGPAVLLLHGFPETHLMWHRVAPALARDCTVVAADLRGYGASHYSASSTPATAAAHAPYGKRAMARDMVAVMRHLGFDQFAVAGHDRGGRVAYRLALDHPDQVTRLAVLDVVPTADSWHRADMRFALGFWPWSLLAQPAPFPERVIGAAPALFVDHAFDSWSATPDAARAAVPDAVRAAYRAALADPATVHAVCEEYRAAAPVDLVDDEADQAAGRRIRCPVPRAREPRGRGRHVVRPARGVAGLGGRRPRARAQRRALPARGGAGGDHRRAACVPDVTAATVPAATVPATAARTATRVATAGSKPHRLTRSHARHRGPAKSGALPHGDGKA